MDCIDVDGVSNLIDERTRLISIGMVTLVVEMRVVKLDRFLLKNQHTQEILLLWKQKNWRAVNNWAHFY
jgi:hypothetical protein